MITAFDDNKITLSKNKWGEGPNTIDLVKDDNGIWLWHPLR